MLTENQRPCHGIDVFLINECLLGSEHEYHVKREGCWLGRDMGPRAQKGARLRVALLHQGSAMLVEGMHLGLPCCKK